MLLCLAHVCECTYHLRQFIRHTARKTPPQEDPPDQAK
jgi:hypothetical protein